MVEGGGTPMKRVISIFLAVTLLTGVMSMPTDAAGIA